MSLKESSALFWEWLTNPTERLLTKYEHEIMKTVELPQSVVSSESKVAGLHQLKFSNAKADIKTPTLLLHGHGATGLFFHRDFPALTKNIQTVYTVDHPDVGLSDLRSFKVPKTRYKVELTKTDKERFFTINQDMEKNRRSVETVEKFYIDHFEQWRKASNLEQMNIVAHSMGAYLAFKYALQHPTRVKKLVLCSPAGVERSIFSLNNKETEGVISQDPASPAYYRYAYLPWPITTFGFGLAKAFGPLGVQVLSKYLALRYSRGSFEDHQIKLLVKYTVHLWFQRNQSFRNFLVLFNNQIIALDPLLDHIKELKVPTYIIYGQHDWMNSQAGYQAFQELEAPAKFKIIENAGHNVFLDNASAFDREVVNFLSEEDEVQEA